MSGPHEFSERPFVAGKLTGLRCFSVDEHGRLKGVIHQLVFRPGVNEAVCDTTEWTWLHRKITAAISSPFGPVRNLAASGGLLPDPGAEKAHSDDAAAEPEHRVGQQDCGCGYYAYTDGGNQYAEPGVIERPVVEAIIEGYGTCTVGTRGFRASKARLVALIDPTPKPCNLFDRLAWRIRRRAWLWEIAGLATLVVNGGIAAEQMAGGPTIRPDWVGGIIALLAGAAWVLGARAQTLARRRPSPTTKAVRLFDLVRRNYPDVPVYATRADAVAAHPLSVPPAPGPDDPDFWERP